jgi:hypothetical protein
MAQIALRVMAEPGLSECFVVYELVLSMNQIKQDRAALSAARSCFAA